LSGCMMRLSDRGGSEANIVVPARQEPCRPLSLLVVLLWVLRLLVLLTLQGEQRDFETRHDGKSLLMLRFQVVFCGLE
jgi:hypothetical protein